MYFIYFINKCDKYALHGEMLQLLDQTGQWEMTDSDLIGQSVMS